MPHLHFYLALSLLILHEMDAIRCHEWRMFPLTFWMKESIGFTVFMLAHIPLFLWIFWMLQGPQREAMIWGMDIFCIIHLGLHLLFLTHPKNEFKDALSWGIIGGCALFGGLDLFWAG